ncbi:MAG: aldehyde dehydrogenase family protein [Anaerolineae bacterium]|nr:aldehyde dehydrogenase family protein [Thermoflexales bacterium]MDW8408072.1 aldehyde dehydrogenase family protein [Anaerolineae bacterium]
MATLYHNLINGEWVGASDGATFETRNPANTNEVVGIYPSATREDVQRAIQAAQAAFPAWAGLPAPARGAILDKAAQIIAARVDDMAVALTREEGKTLAEAKVEATRARDIFKYYAGEGWRMGGDVLPANTPDMLLYTRREPLGVVGLITPWNFPLAIAAWKMAPALIYGNTVVFKPASLAPRVSLMMVEALVEAGLPPGVVNYVTGSGKVAGDEIATNPAIKAISFTGSYAVGSAIYAKAVHNMTRVQLEMGGKNPLVVLSDADLKLAVNLAVVGGFGLTGQACTATSRVVVEESVADAFAEALADAARNLNVGNGLESGVQMGPAVSHDQLETDLMYVEVGRKEGAKLLAGGSRAKDGGFFVQPTVFDYAEPSMRIAQEEIFGPVISILRAKNLDDAIDKANAIGFGLSAGIVTNDLKKAFTFANRIEAGVVKVNEQTTGLALQAPFGGFKHSSANTFKEQGQAAIEFYTRVKTVYMKHG